MPGCRRVATPVDDREYEETPDVSYYSIWTDASDIDSRADDRCTR